MDCRPANSDRERASASANSPLACTESECDDECAESSSDDATSDGDHATSDGDDEDVRLTLLGWDPVDEMPEPTEPPLRRDLECAQDDAEGDLHTALSDRVRPLSSIDEEFLRRAFFRRSLKRRLVEKAEWRAEKAKRRVEKAKRRVEKAR